jgi:hypothetical protein
MKIVDGPIQNYSDNINFAHVKFILKKQIFPATRQMKNYYYINSIRLQVNLSFTQNCLGSKYWQLNIIF